MSCHLCRSPCDAPLLLGDMLQKRNVRCHHYCLLFSSELPQRGKDNEGLQGFILTDIRNVARKCTYRKCHYCRRPGAHATCNHSECTKRFHISCAVYAGALLSFYGSFSVHCSEHRPRQQVNPEKVRDDVCGICLGPASRLDGLDVLSTPCCGHNFHRLCLQRMALSSGYFFTCPICRDKNNRSGFLRHVKKFGVFVPQRDASWETEPNAFSELLENHSGCDQQFCLSNLGRKHMVEGDSDWGQLLCHSCASFGSHRACAGRPRHQPWYCPDCEAVFSARRRTPAAGSRRPTLRQLLMSDQRRATALTMPAILCPDGAELQWQKALKMVSDPHRLLMFLRGRYGNKLTIRTRAVQDPKNPGHVIMPVRLKYKDRQLQPFVVLSASDRWRAEQAGLHQRCSAETVIQKPERRRGRVADGRPTRLAVDPKGPVDKNDRNRSLADLWSQPRSNVRSGTGSKRSRGRPRKEKILRGARLQQTLGKTV